MILKDYQSAVERIKQFSEKPFELKQPSGFYEKRRKLIKRIYF